ncbi:nucleotidyltransferase family protein [Nocardiopsis ansamitocini]|uniref:MobA-like NTP transferase domain-containing protein n=1 Tax=Nocardiopsis ansamitocini TaxID=1670832 RepID=A0A9W6UFW9_9ACTN|nr:nucleotidyltransferase family protein [Nocardiopsis ansamitocini]GLU46006.1 hypothetical protein Nans01_03570 [Nocardiopsis ansamitocini]
MATRPTHPSGVAGLLLAAGTGSRLGTPKALVELAGERLVDRGVRLLGDAGCAPVHVVTGAARVPVVGALEVHNPEWATGMGSSLCAGLASLPDSVPAVVVALADQPLITSAAVRRLLEAHDRGAEVAVAAYSGAPRNPVLLARAHWQGVCALARGDTGARPFLRANPELVTRVECADVAAPDDIDTPEDLARLRAALDGSGS